MFPIPQDRYGIIYVITHIDSGKQYVGQTTVSLKARWQKHVNKAKHARKYPTYIGYAIRKYGAEAFELLVLDHAQSREELDHKECFWMDFLDTRAPSGFNLNGGGSHGMHSEITKQRISKAHKGLISQLRGRARDPEITAKCVATRLERGNGYSPNGIKRPEREIPVLCIETGQVFASRKEAAKFVQITHPLSTIQGICANIIRAFRGGRSAYGYRWKDLGSATRVRNKRKVICIETNQCFSSASEAERFMRLITKLGGCVRGALKDKRCRSAFGYHWKYVEEDGNQAKA